METSRRGILGRNPYGFHPQQYTLRGLGKLVGMEYESMEFQNIRDDIYELRRTKLNVAYSSRDQKPSLQLIRNELKRRHFHVFGEKHGTKFLYYALHIIMAQHSTARFIAKRKGCKKQNFMVENPSESSSIPSEHSRLSPTDSRRSSTNDIQCTKGSIETGNIMDLTDDQNINPIIHNVAVRAPLSSPPDDILKPSQRANNYSLVNEPAFATGETDIYNFLNTCQPPMTHYLRHFVEFGCGTSVYLSAMSRWSTEQRYLTLKKILGFGPPDACLPSEMDIAILENQFNTYFLEDYTTEAKV